MVSASYRSDSSVHIPLPTPQRVHLDENVDDLDGQCDDRQRKLHRTIFGKHADDANGDV